MGNYAQELAKLNDAQRQAVDLIDGPLMVIAGPGTGKTQLLSMRVANILNKTDASPSNILCLTFTEAAARNMRQRLLQLIGDDANHVAIHTFHGFGTEVIQRYPEYFSDRPLLKPVEELGAYEILSSIFSNLPHDNPLQQKLDEKFIHLRSTQTVIGWLKQAGLTPEDVAKVVTANENFIAAANPLFAPVFAERCSPKLLPSYQKLLSDLQDVSVTENSLAQQCQQELEEAIRQVDPNGRYATAMTAWRNTWLTQEHLNHWKLKDQARTKTLKAVIDAYQRYQTALADKGWYTYDDMILRTIKALEGEEELRLTLQEQYQYVMVDEYQDTNGAQNRLLELLADNPVNEDRPNLMVVGDDDQAIYRFQGAELSVMLDFLQRWKDVKQVVLDKNYRSGTQILGIAREVITQGAERLENQVDGVNKELTSGYATPPAAAIHRIEALSELDQYSYVANEINKLIKAGMPPSQIAILAPKHSFLKAAVPYLLDQGLPVSYERRDHILEQPKITELLNLARLVQAASKGQWGEVDAMLSTVLAAEYWQIKPQDIWDISIASYKGKTLWLEEMKSSSNPRLKLLAQAIPALAGQALTLPLDSMLDILIGNQGIPIEGAEDWRLPYRSYYFSDERLERSTQEYFVLLGQLTTLRERLKEYRPGQPLTLANLLEFVELYQKSNLNLLDTNPHASGPEAIELMTAYKAKGLEWDTVFVLGTHNEIWGNKARSGSFSLSLPSNLNWIKPARDSDDDRLRLFYVAITRAKANLYLTSYQQNLAGKPSQLLPWLSQQPAATAIPASNTTDLIHQQEVHWGLTPVQKRSLQDNLQPFLEKYQLSATHLNGFLDLSRGGPKEFFFRHILHFPEALNPSSVYGSAVHEILHYMHCQVNRHGKLPALSVVKSMLSDAINGSSLSVGDKQKLDTRGAQALTTYYEIAKKQMKPDDKSECNFKNEGVTLGMAKLTGKIDVIRKQSANEVAIIDYKTGHAMHNWTPKDPYPKIRAHLYKQQLGLYQLMVQGAAHYKDLTVSELALQFVEPDEDGQMIYLTYKPTNEELQRLEQLVGKVWQHIMDLNFPDTSAYSLDLKGVKQFEDDLLADKI